MRKLIIALALVALCTSMQLHDVLSQEGYEEQTHYFGFKQFFKDYESTFETVLIDGFKTVLEDPSIYATYLKTITTFSEADKNAAFIQCAKGDKPNFFKFLGDQDGVVGPNGSETITLTPRPDDCFESVTV